MATAAAQQDNDIPNWRLVGDWWDLCNCAIGCPCNFGSDPTLGYCEGVLTWLIREGNYGELKISKDLAVVLIIHWEGNVFEKNREFGFLIDDRASPAEREALQKIFTGYAGGAFAAWRDLTLRVDGVEFVPMKVSHDAENWRVEVPGMVEGLGGPFRKYMVPEGDTCRIYNAPRPEVVPGFLTVGTAKRNVVTGAFGRKWDWSNRSSKHIAFDLRGPEDLHLAQSAARPMSEMETDYRALLRRDRWVVATLLIVVTAAAWAFTVDQSRQMDAMEAAMWRDMNMSMNGMEAVVDARRHGADVRDVVGDDGGDDAAWHGAHGCRLRHHQAPAPRARRAARADGDLPGRLCRRLGRLLGPRHGAAMAAAEDRTAHHHDAVGLVLFLRRAVPRRRALPVQPAQGTLPQPLPLARRLHLE